MKRYNSGNSEVLTQKVNTMKKLSTLMAMLFAFSNLGLAQIATGSIGGLVLDANSAVVPGASVVARNDATGQEQKVVSSESGLYLFPTLSTGVYTVSVEKTGFKRVNRGNIEVRIAQRLDLNLNLEVGDRRVSTTLRHSDQEFSEYWRLSVLVC